MNKQLFFDAMQKIAPKELAFDYDNPGLTVGIEGDEINKVLVALDCTVAAADEAKRLGCDLVLTHHPLLFSAVKKISPDDPATAAVFRLIRNGVGMFAAHTNLDCAEGGVNTCLCRALGVKNEQPVPPDGLCRIGFLDEPVMFSCFAEEVERRLDTKVRVVGADRLVKTVMVCGGSGGSEYPLAAECGADVLVTGECKHSQAIEAQTAGVNIIVCGHYETESVVLLPLIKALRPLTPGVEYVLSTEGNPLRPL